MATACGNDSLFKIVEYADLFRCMALDWYDWLHTIQQYLQNPPPMQIFSSNILIAELEAGLLPEKKVAVCLHMAEGKGEAKFEPSLLPFIVYLFLLRSRSVHAPRTNRSWNTKFNPYNCDPVYELLWRDI